VIVADNSDSVSWSRNSLSAGLRNLLVRVHGHEARFFVLTSTQYGASSQAARSVYDGKELVSWRDPSSGVAHARPMTEYTQTCTDENGAVIGCPKPDPFSKTIYTVKGAWAFQMPPPVAAITPSMTAAELAVQQGRVADAVLALGGGGAQQEQPICTLTRYLRQRRTDLPANVVFVVLSDEDDISLPSACVVSYEGGQVKTTRPTLESCEASCSEYRYYLTAAYHEETANFVCVPIDDAGMAHPERAEKKSFFNNLPGKCTTVTMPCGADETSRARAECGARHLLQSCTHDCTMPSGGLGCYVARPNLSLDVCTQPFVEGGKPYRNLLDYCVQTRGPGWGSECTVRGWRTVNAETVTKQERLEPLVNAAGSAQMIGQFKSEATSIFGAGNYFVEAIVLDPAFACPVGPGQSYAPNLRQLASGPSDVFPLCQDYAPALQRIESFAQHLIQTEYPLDLDEYEKVDSVVVTTKTGAKRTVPPGGYQYDRGAKILRFTPGALGPQDESLAVNVARYCERIVE
jgi:hypothetical protein